MGLHIALEADRSRVTGLRKIDIDSRGDVGSLCRGAALLAAGALMGFAACASLLKGRAPLSKLFEALHEDPSEAPLPDQGILRRDARLLSRS